MWRRVALVRTNVSEVCIAYMLRMTRIRGLGTTLAVTSNWSTLRRNDVQTFCYKEAGMTESTQQERPLREHDTLAASILEVPGSNIWKTEGHEAN
jgi:hypothetical protein